VAKDQLAKYEARAAVFKALAHPARLMIVEELSQQRRRCVCELQQLVGSDMSTVSRHLSVLRNAGIVESEKEGTTVYYRLRIRCLGRFFQCVEAVLRANAEESRKALG